MLFFAYFYLAQGGWRWPHEKPPKLTFAIVMLIVLWASSGVLHWGEQQVKAARYGRGRAALAITILMGLGFLALQSLEYMDHLKTLQPTTNVYGSIFYTITSFHAAHLILGLLMLIYVLILPELEPVDRLAAQAVSQRGHLLAFRGFRLVFDRGLFVHRAEYSGDHGNADLFAASAEPGFAAQPLVRGQRGGCCYGRCTARFAR